MHFSGVGLVCLKRKEDFDEKYSIYLYKTKSQIVSLLRLNGFSDKPVTMSLYLQQELSVISMYNLLRPYAAISTHLSIVP